MKTLIFTMTKLSNMSVVHCDNCGSRWTLLSQSFWDQMQSLKKDHETVSRSKRKIKSHNVLSTWDWDILISVYGFLEFIHHSTQWKLHKLSGKWWVAFEKVLRNVISWRNFFFCSISDLKGFHLEEIKVQCFK